MKTYSEKLRDPRWQRKRLEIMQRDNFTCTQCGDRDQTQNIHHWKYSKEPWDAKNEDLTTVCESCHKEIEECKKFTNDCMRDADFRYLLTQIEEFLRREGECKVTIHDKTLPFFAKEKPHLLRTDDFVESTYTPKRPEWKVSEDDWRKSGFSAFDALIDAAPATYEPAPSPEPPPWKR